METTNSCCNVGKLRVRRNFELPFHQKLGIWKIFVLIYKVEFSYSLIIKYLEMKNCTVFSNQTPKFWKEGCKYPICLQHLAQCQLELLTDLTVSKPRTSDCNIVRQYCFCYPCYTRLVLRAGVVSTELTWRWTNRLSGVTVLGVILLLI